MTNLQLAQNIRSSLFADRETIKEAFDYAFDIAEASDNPSAVITAIMVVANTISNQIIANEKETV
jgi:cation transport regulator ChaB